MADFVIIPDSSCDFNRALCERFDIPALRMGTVTFPDGRTIDVDLEWETISPEEYYSLLKDKTYKITTATPLFKREVELYKSFLAKGLDIISVSISGSLSGTYSSSVLAARKALEEYPDRRIECVDSLHYSTSMGLLVALASEQRKNGKTFDEVTEWINKNKYCIHQMGPMDDLWYLASKGRINNFKAFFGTMAGVNPMADFNREGLSEVLVKCKGKAMAFDVSVEYIKKTIVNPTKQTIFVSHSSRKQFAEKYAEMIKEQIKPKEIIFLDTGMSCGANIGPGLVAAYYYGTEISDNLENEKEIMRNIVENYKKAK